MSVSREKEVTIPLKTERMKLVNPSSSGTVTRGREVTRRVTRTVDVDVGKSRIRGGGIGITLAGVGAIKTQITQQLEHHYSESSQRELSVREYFTVEVKPQGAVEAIIDWKLICERGIVHLEALSGETVDVPYQYPIKLDWDLEVVNLPKASS
ncbi:hypothetical protein ACTPOK_20130 [Streptomyces inhibens]|uniref:hypothetical protein n=1 Tax=Streptomyces inhibens TaxID=2293571 RepID=UPI00402A8E89